jgi:F-type H+-transporting ATPase subunit a
VHPLAFTVPPVEELVTWPPIWTLHLAGFDLSINRVVLLIFLATGVASALFLAAFTRPKLVPRGIQNVAEIGVEFVRNGIIMETVGPEGLKWLPYFTALFFFILFNNMLEVIPGINFPTNCRMGMPLFLTGISWVMFNVVGIQKQGFLKYLKNLVAPAGVPAYVLPIFAPIELVSTLIVRPLTLSVRLFANMLAGHMILTVFFLATDLFFAPKITALMAVAPFALAVALLGFEVLVAFLQAYIFTILTAVYIQLAGEHH